MRRRDRSRGESRANRFMVAFLFLLAMSLLWSPAQAGPAGPDRLIGNVVPDRPDTFLVFVPERSEEEIRRDLAWAAEEKTSADSDARLAAGLAVQEEARIDAKKGEIETLEAQADLAKEQDLSSRKEDLERRRDREKLRLKLLEKRQEMRKDEADVARSRKKFAEAVHRLADRELSLLERRARLVRLHGGTAPIPLNEALQANKEVRDAQEKVLESLEDAADRREELAKKQKELTEKRREVFEAQGKILSANAG